MKDFSVKINNIINDITAYEIDNIKKCAKIIFDAMNNSGIVHVFATGHSHMFAEELFYRAGGLVQVNPILEPFLMQHEGSIRSTKFERLTGIAEIIFNSLDLRSGEPFIIVSNSGINSVPVEMAYLAKEKCHPVICITSMTQSSKSSPRNKYDKHLYEVCDIVIDNHTPYGDGVIEKEYGKIGASSSIACSFIAQSIVIEIVNLYEEKGLVPPIYISANTPGGDEHNKELYEKFKSRIKSLY